MTRPLPCRTLAGTLSVKALPGLKLFARNAAGEETQLPATYENGRYNIRFDGQRMSNWLFLK
jgi:hypothetical protein